VNEAEWFKRFPNGGGTVYIRPDDGQAPTPASDEALIAAVSRVLQRDFRLRIGPNTRRHVTNGQQRIPLSLTECDDVARAAVTALRQETNLR